MASARRMAASIRVIAVSAWPSSQSSPRHQGQVGHAGILAGRTRRQSVLLAACLERFEGPFDHFAGTGEHVP